MTDETKRIGEYQILDELGSGGMGSGVWRGSKRHYRSHRSHKRFCFPISVDDRSWRHASSARSS